MPGRPQRYLAGHLSAASRRRRPPKVAIIGAQCSSYFRAPDGCIVTQWPYTGMEYAKSTWRLRPRDWIHQDTRISVQTHRPITPGLGD